jgi:hypothetical protein
MKRSLLLLLGLGLLFAFTGCAEEGTLCSSDADCPPGQQWRKESGAHQQARAENGMYRFKQILGPRLRSRSEQGQRREAMIGVNILNRMTDLGMPESEAMRN